VLMRVAARRLVCVRPAVSAAAVVVVAVPRLALAPLVIARPVLTTPARHFTDAGEGAPAGGARPPRAPRAPRTNQPKGALTGRVKWFDASKGFGFITKEDGTDIFVHFTQIAHDGYRTLEEGQSVNFDIGQGNKGAAAQNVTVSA